MGESTIAEILSLVGPDIRIGVLGPPLGAGVVQVLELHRRYVRTSTRRWDDSRAAAPSTPADQQQDHTDQDGGTAVHWQSFPEEAWVGPNIPDLSLVAGRTVAATADQQQPGHPKQPVSPYRLPHSGPSSQRRHRPTPEQYPGRRGGWSGAQPVVVRSSEGWERFRAAQIERRCWCGGGARANNGQTLRSVLHASSRNTGRHPQSEEMSCRGYGR